MIEHTKITRVIKTTETYTIDIDPKDYLDSVNVEDLKSKILWKNRIQIKNDNIKLVFENIELSNDFINKWKKLTEYIEESGITKSYKERAIKNAEYTEIYSGEYLNNNKNSWRWNDFNYNYYFDFIFDNNKDYKCYLRDHDHYDHFSTTLLFAEPI